MASPKDIFRVIIFLPGGLAAGFVGGLLFGLLSQLFSKPVVAWFVPLPLLTQAGHGGEQITNVFVNMIAVLISVAISSRLRPSFVKRKTFQLIWLLIFSITLFLTFREWRMEEGLSRAALITDKERAVPTTRLITEFVGISLGYLLSLKIVFKSRQPHG